jgi:hypothetical protein
MSDFFADLERQLVDATPRRAQRLRRARLRRTAALSATLLAVLAGGVGIATAISGGDGATSAGGGPAAAPSAPTSAQTIPGGDPRRGAHTVAILNGTTVPGLARGVANRLQNARFKIGNVTNAADQTVVRTRVFFARRADMPLAMQAAATVGLRDGTLRPITEALRTIAGDQAAVVVVVGSDQNTAPSP